MESDVFFLGHFEKQQECWFVRTKGQTNMMEPRDVCTQRPTYIQTPIHRGEQWEQECGLWVKSSPYEKANKEKNN